MGKLEKEVKRKNRPEKIQRVLLASIYAAGVLSVALVAPKALKLIAKFEPSFLKDKYHKYSLNRSLANLRKRGLIVFENTGKGKVVRLTPEGEVRLRQIERNSYKLPRPNHWDRKWRLLIFDIKEERKTTRDKIRQTLLQVGFVRLQDSVWAYPYDCEDFIMLLKADFRIGKDVQYIIAERIEYDRVLRQQFDL